MKLHQKAMAMCISTAPDVLISADPRFVRQLRLNAGHPGAQRIDPAVRRLGELTAAAAVAAPS